MKMMGFSQVSVDRLIKMGKFKTTERYKGKKKLILIEADSAREMKLKIKQSLSLTSAGELLGLTPRSVIDLVYQGCLEALSGRTVDGSAHWKFSRETIKELLTKIKKRFHLLSL